MERNVISIADGVPLETGLDLLDYERNVLVEIVVHVHLARWVKNSDGGHGDGRSPGQLRRRGVRYAGIESTERETGSLHAIRDDQGIYISHQAGVWFAFSGLSDSPARSFLRSRESGKDGAAQA